MHNQEITIASLIVLLFLPSIVVASADNQKHPLHGYWTSQSESEEDVELIFYPDGSFYMSVARDESWGVIAEEDYEDEEDSEAWEEFIVEEESCEGKPINAKIRRRDDSNESILVEISEISQQLGDFLSI